VNRLKQIKPDVEVAAQKAGLPASSRADAPFPVGFDGDAWVWTWRKEKEIGIAEVSVVARPEAEVGVEIRVSGGAWMSQRRRVTTSRLFYSRFFDKVPPRGVLVSELEVPLRNAWQSALTMADQLFEIEKNQSAFVSSLKEKGWLVE